MSAGEGGVMLTRNMKKSRGGRVRRTGDMEISVTETNKRKCPVGKRPGKRDETKTTVWS